MLKQSQIDLCGRVDFTREVPLLGRDEAFSFACAGCGDCCRGREDIVLSGFDLWRIAARLRLPTRTVARAFCKASIGQVSRLPVLRLAPVREEGNNCPFLTEDHCAIHEAEPLVCALYPLAQEITREGEVGYFLQPTAAAGRCLRQRWGTIWPGTMSRRGRRRMCAGRRPALRWKTGWRRWKRSLNRSSNGGCSRNCGRRSIINMRSHSRSCRNWRKISSGWRRNSKSCPRCNGAGTCVLINPSKKSNDKITSINNLGCGRIVFGQEMCYTSRV